MRLVDQKGIPILLPAMWNLLVHADVQFVLLGTGQYHFETEAWKLGDAFRKKAAVVLAFDSKLAEMIYAGSDMFVMPSLFEPCGIGQMIAMRYGSIPVARSVGGLVDTVTPDVGFLFKDFHPGALQWAISRALDVYFNKPEEWDERQRRAMAKNFDWSASAARYQELYTRTVEVHHTYHAS
jgi:starch synthase